MDDTTNKVTAAALFHDIGKLADRDLLNLTEKYVMDNEDIYLPKFNNAPSHWHALYTAAFIEYNQGILPKVFNRAGWGEGDSFVNLAACHHKPESPLQWIIAIADRVSSGWDRDRFDAEYNQQIPWKDYRKTRLLPLFEQLKADGAETHQAPDDFSYCYPLEPMSPAVLFPKRKENVLPETNEDAKQAYRILYDRFIRGLGRLKYRDENLMLWLEHFESLLMVFTSAMPAARAGNVLPDVSLYDHSKASAALATALYLYHREKGLEVEAVRDYADKKLLLISGDFFGIQNFIFSGYSQSRKFRSKILRGRSFMVSLLTEMAAEVICRAVGLPFTSVLFNAAGKFSVLAPNTTDVRAKIKSAEDELNRWLHKISYGETVIGFTAVGVSCNDLVEGNFPDLWDVRGKRNDEKKFQRINLKEFGGPISDYLNRFEHPEHPLCPICGKRPSALVASGSPYIQAMGASCPPCRDHIFLGARIVRKQRLAIIKAGAVSGGGENSLLEPLFGQYQVVFPDDLKENDLDAMIHGGDVVRFWDLGKNADAYDNAQAAIKFISGYVPSYSEKDAEDPRIQERLEDGAPVEPGAVKTLSHIACQALNPTEKAGKYRGMDALGVLKADVDHLGMLMSCGLEKRRFTLSRLATLSRQLHFYFAVYLPDFLKNNAEYKDVYTVFAGGDDLFLIGPWNTVINLSVEMQRSFSEYVCRNSAVHFSAGVSIHKPNTPVDIMASASEKALEKSKDSGRNRLTLFSETASWPEVPALLEIQNKLLQWMADKTINNAMLYRLNALIRMAAMEKAVTSGKKIHLKDMDAAKWRAYLVYATERNIGKHVKKEAREAMIREVSSRLMQWLDAYGASLKMPLWAILYDNR